MEETLTEQEWCERSARRYFRSIQIPYPTRTNSREFANAWSNKYGGTFNNGYWAWKVTYHEEHSRDLSKPYISL